MAAFTRSAEMSWPGSAVSGERSADRSGLAGLTRGNKLQRAGIALARTPPIDRLREYRPCLRHGGLEQGHRRPELHIIRRAKNVMQRARVAFKHRAGAARQPGTQERMSVIGARFVERANPIEPRRRRLPSPRSWGKMNHIQCVRLRPACNSSSTVSKTGACAVTKRFRSNGSSVMLCSSVPGFSLPGTSLPGGAILASRDQAHRSPHRTAT